VQAPRVCIRGELFAAVWSGLVWPMGDFDTALHLEEQHKAEGQADGYRCYHTMCLRALCYHTSHPYKSSMSAQYRPFWLLAFTERVRCRDGRAAGLREGRELGVRTGFEVAEEVGFYSGCTQARRGPPLRCFKAAQGA